MLETSPDTPSFLIVLILHIVIYTELVTLHVYRDLHSQGIGTFSLSPEEVEKLWTTGVMSSLDPKSLQRAVF